MISVAVLLALPHERLLLCGDLEYSGVELFEHGVSLFGVFIHHLLRLRGELMSTAVASFEISENITSGSRDYKQDMNCEVRVKAVAVSRLLILTRLGFRLAHDELLLDESLGVNRAIGLPFSLVLSKVVLSAAEECLN